MTETITTQFYYMNPSPTPPSPIHVNCTRTQHPSKDDDTTSKQNPQNPQPQNPHSDASLKHESVSSSFPPTTQDRLQIMHDYPQAQGHIQELSVLPSTPSPPSIYSTHDDTLYVKLLQFYKMSGDGTENPNLDIMVEHKSRVSLRLLDWCVTNYAKQRYITYDITSASGAVTRFNMHNSYHLKLDSYSKERFDPFRRGTLIQFPYKNNLCIETTIAQLSFYKWAIEHRVLEYIDANYEAIERDMNARNSNSRRARPKQVAGAQKTRKRREELSVAASKFIKKEHVRTEISFS